MWPVLYFRGSFPFVHDLENNGVGCPWSLSAAFEVTASFVGGARPFWFRAVVGVV